MSLDAYLNDVDEALHDLDLEDEGHSPAFYWDTAQVRDALLGHAYYYDFDPSAKDPEYTFVKSRFESDMSLIYCLASAKWFGQIRLLQPHQAELLKLANREFNIGAMEVPLGGRHQFIKDVQLGGVDRGEIDHLSELSPERITRLVELQVGQAPRLFKVVQALHHGYWKPRLAHWLQEGIFQLDKAPYDYRAVLNSHLFERIHSALDADRGDKKDNNLTDAIALCQLQLKVQNYRQGITTECPRYLTSALYNRILTKEALFDQFVYTFKDRTYGVFRTPEYFKLRANIIKPPDQYEGGNRQRRIDLLYEVRRQLEELYTARQPLEDHMPLGLAAHNKHIPKILHEVQQYSFLEEVWLPYAAKAETLDAVRSYVHSANEFAKSEAVQLELHEQVEGFLNSLKEVSLQFQNLGRLSKELQDAVRGKVDIQDTHKAPVDFYVLSGLIRFGFPPEQQQQITDLVARITSPDATIRSKAVFSVLKQMLENEEQADTTRMVIGGVMWALGMYERVRALLPTIDQSTHYSLRCLSAAAGLKLNEIFQCQQAIVQLETDYNRLTEASDRLALAISLGYLCFHLRESYRSGHIRLNEKETRKLLEKAVFYATAAREMAGVETAKRVYALNQQLYYMVSDPELYSRQQVSEVADALMAYEENKALWQYRYDDTLAAYNEWMAVGSPDKRRRLEVAMQNIQNAWDGCRRVDPEVGRHLHRIMNARERLD